MNVFSELTAFLFDVIVDIFEFGFLYSGNRNAIFGGCQVE